MRCRAAAQGEGCRKCNRKHSALALEDMVKSCAPSAAAHLQSNLVMHVHVPSTFPFHQPVVISPVFTSNHRVSSEMIWPSEMSVHATLIPTSCPKDDPGDLYSAVHVPHTGPP